MDEYESLSHTKGTGKSLVVFIPKCRGKTLAKIRHRPMDQIQTFTSKTIARLHGLTRTMGGGWRLMAG